MKERGRRNLSAGQENGESPPFQISLSTVHHAIVRKKYIQMRREQNLKINGFMHPAVSFFLPRAKEKKIIAAVSLFFAHRLSPNLGLGIFFAPTREGGEEGRDRIKYWFRFVHVPRMGEEDEGERAKIAFSCHLLLLFYPDILFFSGIWGKEGRL